MCIEQYFSDFTFHHFNSFQIYKEYIDFTCWLKPWYIQFLHVDLLRGPHGKSIFLYGCLKKPYTKMPLDFSRRGKLWSVCKNNGVYTKISIVVFCPAIRDCTLFLLLIYCTVSSIVFNSGPWIAPSTDRSLYRSRICNYAWLRLRSSSSSVPCTNCTAVYQSHLKENLLSQHFPLS